MILNMELYVKCDWISSIFYISLESRHVFCFFFPSFKVEFVAIIIIKKGAIQIKEFFFWVIN